MELIKKVATYATLVAAITLTSQLTYATTADNVICSKCVGMHILAHSDH